MKTIEEIISQFNKFEIESFDHHPINALSFDDCINAMKIYANQKLDEAAFLLNTNSSTCLWQEEILNLKD